MWRFAACVSDLARARNHPYNPERAAELLAALEEYRLARERLLSVLGPRMSNRDPLAEFAEHFVAALMGGRLVVSPVQVY